MTDPAHSPEVERAVLSVLLHGRHPSALANFVDVCRGPLVFFVLNHQIIMLAVLTLAEAGKPIGYMETASQLRQMPWHATLDVLKAMAAGTTIRPSDVPDLSDSAMVAVAETFAAIDGLMGSPSGFAEDCRTIAAYHTQRQMASALQEAMDHVRAVDGAQKAPAIADQIINRLAALVIASEGTTTISGAMRKAMVRHQATNVIPDARAASWGIPALDRSLQLRPCRYVVLAAQPGHGKSSLALQAATATAAELGNASVAMVNLEMPPEQIGTILLAREIKATARTIESGRLTVEQSAEAEAEIVRREEADIYLRTATRKVTIDEICAWIRQRHVRSAGRLVLVVIDYLQLIGGKGRQTEYDRISEASQHLKLLANELRVCLLVLSQLNREGSKSDRDSHGRSKGNPEPRMQDLRGSGSIEQDADAILFIWPPGDVDDSDLPVVLRTAKNRGGPSGKRADISAVFERARGQTFRQTSAPSSLDPVASSRAHHNHPPHPSEDGWAERTDVGQTL